MSIKKLNLQELGATLRGLAVQLPFPLAYVLLGIGSGIHAIKHPDGMSSVLWLLCIPCALLSLSLSLTAGARAWARWKKFAVQLVPIAVLLAYLSLLPGRFSDFEQHDGIVYALLLLTAALLLTFLPLLGNKDANRLWLHNHKLVSRAVFSGAFSAVLYGGVALALVAIEHLFEVKVAGNAYAYLAVLSFGLFGASFFLAAFVGERWEAVEEIAYPKILKVFTLYLLFPLTAVYMLILYLYFLRICLAWELPRGWASSLVLVLAGVGMLAYAASLPLAQKGKNMLTGIFHRYFFPLFAPLLLLLFAASGRRIADYGVTEMRYFLAVIAMWLAFVVGYFIVSRKKDLRLIPLTLAAVAVLSSFGPQSAFSVSWRSQTARLEKIMRDNGLLQQGQLTRSPTPLTDSVSIEVNIVLHYLEGSEAGLQPLEQRWNTTFERDSVSGKIEREAMAKALQLSTLSAYQWQRTPVREYLFRWKANTKKPIDVTGYRQMFTERYLSDFKSVDRIPFFGKTLTIQLTNEGESVQLLLNGKLAAQQSITDYVKAMEGQGWVAKDGMTATPEDKSLDFALPLGAHELKFVVAYFKGEKQDSTYKAEQISYQLLVR